MDIETLSRIQESRKVEKNDQQIQDTAEYPLPREETGSGENTYIQINKQTPWKREIKKEKTVATEGVIQIWRHSNSTREGKKN